MNIFANVLDFIFTVFSNLTPWLYIAFLPTCYFFYEKGIEEGQLRGYNDIFYKAGTRKHPEDISAHYISGSQVSCHFDLSSHTLYIDGSGPMDDLEYYPWWDCARYISKIHIASGITHIGVFAFRGCHCSSVFIPASVESIGYHAFEYMPLLKFVILASHSTTLDDPFNSISIDLAAPKIMYKDEL